MDHVLQFFQQLDNLVWGAPLLVLLVMVGLGGFLKLDLVWVIADIVNGLMALPNLIALLALSPLIVQESRRYLRNKKTPDRLIWGFCYKLGSYERLSLVFDLSN